MTGMMKKLTVEEARAISKAKGLLPGKVRGTTIVQFTYGDTKTVEVIEWDEFADILEREGKAVFYEKGFMRVMREG